MRHLSFAVASTIILWATAAVAAPRSEAERIEASLKAIEQSKLTFVRNGDEHSAKAAAEHLRGKLKKAGSKVKTFDEFVEVLATRSSFSGKPYQLKLANGSLVPLAGWLREKDSAEADAGK